MKSQTIQPKFRLTGQVIRVIAVILLCSQGAIAQQTIVEISAGEQDRTDVPVRFDLPDRIDPSERYVLKNVSTNELIAVQSIDENVAIAIISKLKAGANERFELQKAGSPITNADRVAVQDDGKSLAMFVNEKPVLTYNAKVVESPEGIDPVYRRSGHVHPIFDPDGRTVTDDFSPDHAHQHAMFFAWVNATYKGRKVDFWNQREQTGGVRHSAKFSATGGEVFGRIEVGQTHFVTTDGKQIPVVDERWEIIVYAIDSHFVFDLTSTQKLIGETPLKINEYHYGGFALRGHRDWAKPKKGGAKVTPNNAGFLTSESKTRADGNHSRPNWTSMFGDIDGRASNITVIDHKDNFRHPQPVRLHPSMPYFCQAPMVLGEFQLTEDGEYVSRYRLIVSANEPDAKFLDRCSFDYNNPPVVKVD